MKVVAINGSPKPNGNTFHALKIVCEELEKEGISSNILHVGNMTLKDCISCGRCKEGYCVHNDDKLMNMVDEIYEADGLILGSPVYYSGITGSLKNFLDRLFYAEGGRMRHKAAAAISIPRRSGGIPAFDQMNYYFLTSEMLVVTSYYWNVIYGSSPKEVLEDFEGVSVLRNLARNMSWFIKIKEATKDTIPVPEAYPRSWMNFIR